VNAKKLTLNTLNVRMNCEDYTRLQELCQELSERGAKTNVSSFVNDAVLGAMAMIEQPKPKLPRFIGVARYAKEYEPEDVQIHTPRERRKDHE
tara:strand:+ start:10586 stop:10864 length:279 start_codon:yes stop_codon:yes gene_type:complete